MYHEMVQNFLSKECAGQNFVLYHGGHYLQYCFVTVNRGYCVPNACDKTCFEFAALMFSTP